MQTKASDNFGEPTGKKSDNQKSTEPSSCPSSSSNSLNVAAAEFQPNIYTTTATSSDQKLALQIENRNDSILGIVPPGTPPSRGNHASISQATQPAERWRESSNWRRGHETVTRSNEATYDQLSEQMIRSSNWRSGHFSVPVWRLKGLLAQKLEPRPGELRVTIFIPDDKVGLVIGTMGSCVKWLEEQTECRIISCCSSEARTPDGQRPVNMTGTPLGISEAYKTIWGLIDSSWDRLVPTTRNSPNQAQNHQAYLVNSPPSQKDHEEERPSSRASNGSPATFQEAVTGTPPAKASDNHRDFSDYTIREYLPGHYIPTSDILKNLNVPGGHIRKAQLQEFVENLKVQSKNNDAIRIFNSKLQRENNPTLRERKGTRDISNLLKEIKNNKEEFYSFDDAIKLLEGMETTDLYVPTEEAKAIYRRNIIQSQGNAASSLSPTSSILWLPVLVSEIARLTAIGEELAYRTQSKQEDENKYSILQERYEKLKMENLAKDNVLFKLREQHSKLLEQYDGEAQQEYAQLQREKDMVLEQLNSVLSRLQKELGLRADDQKRFDKLRAEDKKIFDTRTRWLRYENAEQKDKILTLELLENAHKPLRGDIERLERDNVELRRIISRLQENNMEQSKTIAAPQEVEDRQQSSIEEMESANKELKEQIVTLRGDIEKKKLRLRNLINRLRAKAGGLKA